MAFDKDYLARSSVALNTGMVIASGSEPAAPTLFTYRSADDTVATIVAANYFADAVYQLSLNDMLYISGSDAVGLYVVNAINRAAGTITLLSAGINGVVDTANIANGAVLNAQVGAAAAIAYSKLATLASGNILVGSAGNVATSVAMSGDVAIVASGATTIQAGAVDKAMLNATVRPSHMIVFADQETSVGGAAAEAFTVTGAVAATDRAFVQMVDNGTNNVTILQAVVTNDTLTVTFSADPGNDAVINYQLIRATS